jgi:predicted dehydrogenase
MRSDRRTFLGAVLGTAAAPAVRIGRGSPNDRIRLAVVGLARGASLLRSLHRLRDTGVEVVALCDVDSAVLERRAAAYEKLAGRRLTIARDMRRLLDDLSIDGVVHATPTNWHALGGIWTLQAGKDGYIEKPLTLSLWEGEKLAEAARKYKRIVQHGTQCRSSPEILEAISRLREGVIGEVYMARGTGHKYRPGIGPVKPEQPPATLDYDMWRGPAPMKPYSKNQVHYNWHWFWDTGNGDMGNLGVHALDLARMALDLPDYPEKVQSMGGSYIFGGAKETPNVQNAAFQFRGRKVMLEYSVRNGYTNTEAGVGEAIPMTLSDPRDGYGLVVFGSEGYMVIPDYSSYRTYLGRNRKPGPSRIGQGPPESNEPHLQNFLNAMRSRRTEDLTADVEVGRRSAALCHLANIAYRVRETLTVDPATGRILGNAAAAALSRRAFRPPYVVPDTV